MLKMATSKKGKIEIASYEGLCLRPYYDSVVVITLGLGSTETEIPDLKKWDKTKYITIQKAVDLFNESLINYENTVNLCLKNPVWQYQFDALVSICYNIGQSAFKHSTFIKLINNNASPKDITNAIMSWDKPHEIITRRRHESTLFSEGKYSSNGFIELLDTDGKGHQLQHTAKEINITPYF